MNFLRLFSDFEFGIAVLERAPLDSNANDR
jgi:hypothetical protein